MKNILHLPKNTANAALYLQANILPLSIRVHLLSLRIALKIIFSPICHTYHGFFLFDGPLHNLNPSSWHYANPPIFVTHYEILRPILMENLHLIPTMDSTIRAYPNSFPTFCRDQIFNQNWPLIIENTIMGMSEGNTLVIATDGSVAESRAGCAAVFPDRTISVRLPDFCSPFDAEAFAFDAALDVLRCSSTDQYQTILILTDCQSLVRFIEDSHVKDNNYFAWKISSISEAGRIKLIWIPGHVGFPLNEAADRAAKASLDLPLDQNMLPLSVCLPLFVIPRGIRSLVVTTRAQQLSTLDINKYRHLIKPVPNNRQPPLASYPADYIFTRFRLNRPPVAYKGYRFANEGGFCMLCHDQAFDADQFLMFCPRYVRARNEMINFIESNTNIPPTTENILSFPSALTKRSYHTFKHAVNRFITAVLHNLR